MKKAIFISDPHGEFEEFKRLKDLAEDKLGGIADIFVLGDIYDRGPEPHSIMDFLMEKSLNQNI